MFNELQTAMLRTAHLDEPRDRALSLCGLGLAGEAGEIADLIKKIFYHGKPFDREKLIEEGGDLAWYIGYLAYVWELDLDDLVDPVLIKNLFPELTESQRFTRIANQLTSTAGYIAFRLDTMVFELPGYEHLPLKYTLAELFRWLEALALALNSTLEEMCRFNISKLEKRYPNGFNTADSLARKDEAVKVK